MDGAGNCACDYDFAHTGSFVFFTRLMAFSGLRALLVPSIGPRRHSALWSTKDGRDRSQVGQRESCSIVSGWHFHVSTRRELHRSEEHTSELQSLMRISYAVFCLK